MFVDHTKQMEKYTATNIAKASEMEALNAGNGIFDFAKLQETYRMTEDGNIYMPDAVYQKPDAQEEKSVIEQLDTEMDMSAANRKNQMVVVSNTASAEDLKEISKDGFDALDADSHTILTVTDKIKAVLAKAGVDISIYGDDLSMEQLEAATGSSAVAIQIVNALKKADLPITDANLQESVRAYNAAEELMPLNDETKEYMLKNGWEPTIKNLYLAEHSGFATKHKTGIDFAALEEQIQKIITDAGLPVSDETKADCQWLIERGIALTKSNLKYINGLNVLSQKLAPDGKGSLDMEQVIARMMEAIRDGRRPIDALLIDGFSYEDRAKAVMETVMTAEDCDVAYCVEQQMSVSVENLQTAINNRGEEGITEISVEMSTNIKFITAKRQLEETRLAMTIEANYTLLKRGIAIDTKPLEQLVENLKSLETQYYKSLMRHSGVESTAENLNMFVSTTKYVEELRYQPAYILEMDSAKASIQKMHEVGSKLKTSMDAALKSYETLWTTPNAELGDSITKAFENIDEILSDLDLEINPTNQRAVRILAYNQTEITVENITQIKNVDMEMQKLFRNLTPAKTLELIREGFNPLDMEIEELNKVVETLEAETGEKENERFSKFLWKLEQNNEITAEERDSYIGIYRLMAQVEKTDGAALGALLNQGADITMRNLLSAMRSAKANMDYKVDDNFVGAKPTAKGPLIDHQIMAAYQNNCVKEVVDLLSPEMLEQIEEWEEMTPEQLLETLKQLQTEEESMLLEQKYYTELAQQYTGVLEASDEVYEFLERYEMKNSARNVLAASRLLNNPSNVFETLFNTDGKSEDYKEMIGELKDQVLKNFGEAIKTPQEMADAQATLAEVAERVMQTMIIENEPASIKDINDLRLMSQQFYLCNQRTKEESFLVPVETGDTVTGVNLKIVRGKVDRGWVEIFFRGALQEKVAASFEAKKDGITGIVATTDEKTRKYIAENLNVFVEKISQNGQEKVEISVVQVKDLSAWQYEKSTLSKKDEPTPVQTKRLYGIAESFIQTVSDLM